MIRGIHRVESHGDLHLTAVKACAVPNTGRSEAASQDPDSFLSFQTSVPPCTKGLTVHSVSAAGRSWRRLWQAASSPPPRPFSFCWRPTRLSVPADSPPVPSPAPRLISPLPPGHRRGHRGAPRGVRGRAGLLV